MTSILEGLLAKRRVNWKRLEKGEVGAEGEVTKKQPRGPQETLGEGKKMKKGRDEQQRNYLKTQSLGEIQNKEIKIIFQGIFEQQPMYLSGSTPVTLTWIQAHKPARTPSVSPVPATCHLQYAVPSLRNSASVHIFLTVPDSTGRFIMHSSFQACFVKEAVADTLACVWGNGSTRDEITCSRLSGKALAELRPEPKGLEFP